MDRLKNLEHLTVQEQAVVDTIQRNPNDVLTMSSHSLAKQAYVSPATVVRLCQKLGLSGFTEFKRIYTSEFERYQESVKKVKAVPFGQDSKVEDIIQTLPLIYQRVVNYTQSLLNPKVVQACAELMQKAQHIGIYGMGLNYDIAKVYQYKLQAIGLNAVAYNATNWSWLERIYLEKIPSMAIVITQTGRNRFILDALKQLRSYQIPSLLITGRQDRQLDQKADYVLHAMTGADATELSTTLFSVSMTYLLDILTISMHVRYFETIERVTKKSQVKREEWSDD